MSRIRLAAPAVLGALALVACRSEVPAADARPLVRTALVGEADAAVLRYTGVVRPRTESDLGFRVGGKVVQRLVDPGQRVRRGQVLMRIDATDLQLEASASRDQLRSAEARAAQAVAEETRQRRLLDAGAVSRSAYDAALAASESAQAAVAATRASARRAGNQAGYGSLLADADGIVTDVLAQPGQVIAPGEVVLRLARAGNREAAIAVPETQLATLPRNGRAYLYGSTTPILAQLREVAGVADPLTRTFDVRFVLSQSELPLGSTVTVELPRATSAEIQAPLTALHDPGSGPGVWVVQNNKVRFRPVRVARLGEETASIASSSLLAGERIVILGANRLREGQAVRLAAPSRAVRP
ncbi:efflux RND transporter periplasmic adaptor subunit [Brevundimonas naejangsanensis]|uniref:Efflux RND transporter periplasmic adaptor subunit n=1 Tax=Brevundimonas naejangsanensis TaxID=588932 RepID=A0A494RHD4_9CAUL|nr:efflux RND transporter periplasmic adaptor subunit [Brevundimonas naejangsanensis]AYG95781.1 efflux RND transporter periplasmic adaptor subunit [Brevundimonas naejangsanensis]